MEERPQALFFEEEQSFPLWMRAIVLLAVVACGYPTILMWSSGGVNSGLVRVLFTVPALVALGGAALTLGTKLITKLDSSNLRLRIYPLRWNVLPRRMTQKDIALSDIRRWEVRTYIRCLAANTGDGTFGA
jgi:hypothetical protein